MDDVKDGDLLEVINIFHEIEKSGLLEEGWSYHMEFGLRPVFFYQIKPFKRIEETADKFVLKMNVDVPHLRLIDVIGRTPRGGITLPFRFVNKYEFEESTHMNPLVDISKPYGLLIKNRGMGDDAPITIPMGKMHAFFINASYINLFHGTYRFIKRADLSCFGWMSEGFKEKDIPFLDLPNSMLDYKGEVRLFSDGGHGLLIPLEL